MNKKILFGILSKQPGKRIKKLKEAAGEIRDDLSRSQLSIHSRDPIYLTQENYQSREVTTMITTTPQPKQVRKA